MATDPTLQDEAPASPKDTRLALLARTPRPYVKIRHTFVQKRYSPRRPAAPRGAVLGDFVTDHQQRALDAFLLLLALEPWLDSDNPVEAGIWARALCDDPLSLASVSRVWLQLERRRLIERGRRKGHAFVRPTREDGKGVAYVRPGRDLDDGKPVAVADQFFVLPHDYWALGLDQKLGMPGKALLLIGLHLTGTKPTFYLPYDSAPKWYGLSPETVARGVRELRDAGLLQEYFQKVKADLSPTGLTTRTHYRLEAPFSMEARAALQKSTTKVVRRKAVKKARAIKKAVRRKERG
jgi:hypothetical protein